MRKALFIIGTALVLIGPMAAGASANYGTDETTTSTTSSTVPETTTTEHDHTDHVPCGPNTANDGCFTPTYPAPVEVCPTWLETPPPCATGPATPLAVTAPPAEVQVLDVAVVEAPAKAAPELAYTGSGTELLAVIGGMLIGGGATLATIAHKTNRRRGA
jgi:hypothetical protein